MIVFLHIPKTAGSTFQFILENTFGVSACHTNHNKKDLFDQTDFDFARKVFPRLRSIAGHNLVDPLQLKVPDPFYLTFVREPVARVISQYRDAVRGGRNSMTFEQSLRSGGNYENLQVKLMAGERNLDKAKAFLQRCGLVGLTEKFDLSLHLLGRLGPRRLNLKYKRRRVSPADAIKDSLENDRRLIDMAREHNRLDLELYSFAVNEVFPALCARAGLSPSDPAPAYDDYPSELHPQFLLCSLYNMLFYRQICKLR